MSDAESVMTIAAPLRDLTADGFLTSMSRGLGTFDAFSWASLLAGKEVLVCDGDEKRAFRTADALEEAGARATIAGSQPAARERLARRSFALAVVTVTDSAGLEPEFVARLDAAGTQLVILAGPGCETALAAAHPSAKILTLATSRRDLVMSLTGTADE